MASINTLNEAIESLSHYYTQHKETDFVKLYNKWSSCHRNLVKNELERDTLISYCQTLVESEPEAVKSALL